MNNNSSFVKYVDHTYRDYSLYLQNGGQMIKHKKSTNNFPTRIQKILSIKEYSDVITWMPHGRAFKVLNKEELINTVIPNFFVCSKYESFTRQLTAWGFKRLYAKGPDEGCYYHEAFLRGLPQLTCFIRRLPPNLGKSAKHPDGEPDFYTISDKFPVPPPDTIQQQPERTLSAVAATSSPTSALGSPSKPPYQRGMSASSGQLLNAPTIQMTRSSSYDTSQSRYKMPTNIPQGYFQTTGYGATGYNELRPKFPGNEESAYKYGGLNNFGYETSYNWQSKLSSTSAIPQTYPPYYDQPSAAYSNPFPYAISSETFQCSQQPVDHSAATSDNNGTNVGGKKWSPSPPTNEPTRLLLAVNPRPLLAVNLPFQHPKEHGFLQQSAVSTREQQQLGIKSSTNQGDLTNQPSSSAKNGVDLEPLPFKGGDTETE